MERPGNHWVNPTIGAATAGLAALTVREQYKARKAQEEAQHFHEQEKAYKRRVQKFEGVNSARRNFKEGITTRDEALAHCAVIGVSDPEKCIPKGLCPVKAETQQPLFEKSKPQQINKTSKENPNDSKKDVLSDIDLPYQFDTGVQDIYLEPPHQIDIGFQDFDSDTGFSVECLDENKSYFFKKQDVFIHENAGPPLDTSCSTAPFINPNGLTLGIGAAALYLMAYSGLRWLKKKNPIIKKYFTTNEEFFLESHELIHKKLDKILEDQEKK